MEPNETDPMDTYFHGDYVREIFPTAQFEEYDSRFFAEHKLKDCYTKTPQETIKFKWNGRERRIVSKE